MWKEIPWTKGAYSASDDRFIKSNERLGKDGRRLNGVILKPWLGNHGYLTVNILVDGKSYRSLDGKLIKTYEAVLDVCREHGYEPSALSRAADGKQKTSYGYLWRWCEESVTTIPQGSSCAGENPPAKGESL